MQQKTRTWWLGTGVGALLAFSALVYYLFPQKVKMLGVDSGDFGGVVLTVLIVWLVMRKNQPLAPKERLLLGVLVGVGLLLGLAIFFMT